MGSSERNFCNWMQEIIIVKLIKIQGKSTVLLPVTSCLAYVNLEKPWLFFILSFRLNCFLVKPPSCHVSQRSGDSSASKVSVSCARWPPLAHQKPWTSLSSGKGCPGVSVLEQGNKLCRKGLGILADSPLSRSQLSTGSVVKSHIRGCVSNNIVNKPREMVVLICSHLLAFLRPHLR